MKNFAFLLLCSCTLLFTSCNNHGSGSKELSHKDSLLFEQLKVFQDQLRESPFKLYATKNIYTFLELNTATGQIWIVQWSTKGGEQFRYDLDDNIRTAKEDELICGRFELYPTENIYNFILLDNLTGNCWQVQWSFEKEQRMVIPIN